MILLNILNSLVPTAAIALVAWGALRLLRANAATRYGVWWVVLASVVGIVLWPQSSAPAASVPPVAVEPARLDWLLWAIAAWAAFALYRTVRIVVGYAWLRRIVKHATPWDRSGVVLSDEATTPFTAGFAHPVIVLPASFPEKLTDEEMQHVLLHEEAHIARRDQWANLLARIAGVFFGLHPVAAFALHRIERERERACDDWVVVATGEAKPYAASLTRVFELTRQGSQPDLASGFMGSRLGGRIEELLTQGRQFTRRASIAMIAAIVVPIVILGLRTPITVAFAQERQPQPAKPVTQAAPATTPAKPAIPVTQAPPSDAMASRMEALIARLEAVLERVSQVPPVEELSAREQRLVLSNARLQAMQEEMKAREAEMKAIEQQMRDQQRVLEMQLQKLRERLGAQF